MHWLYLTDVSKPQNQFVLLGKCSCSLHSVAFEAKYRVLGKCSCSLHSVAFEAKYRV